MAKKLKVVVTDYIEPDLDWETQQFAERGIDFECAQLKFEPESKVIDFTRDADVVVVNMVKITEAVIDSWTNCKVVVRHGAGYDNVDVDALTKRDILLEYIPDYCTHEVAEQAIGLMFACARKVLWSQKVMYDSVERGEWDFRPIHPMFRLDGRTIGIVGCGRIGSLVYKKLEHFGVKFLICDPYLSERRRKGLGIETTDLKTLCEGSDFVTVHTPLNDDTRKLINAEVLSWMKPTAYLVNTSRGGMVDHEALAAALKSKQIAGAAIDVYETEPPKPDFPLIGLDNVLLTPHLSWYSEDSDRSIREKIVEAVDMYATGKSPRLAVNAEVVERWKD